MAFPENQHLLFRESPISLWSLTQFVFDVLQNTGV